MSFPDKYSVYLQHTPVFLDLKNLYEKPKEKSPLFQANQLCLAINVVPRIEEQKIFHIVLP